MIVISNRFLPKTKNHIDPKKKPIADTETGDVAYYITKSDMSKRKPRKYYDSESDDDDDDDDDFDKQIILSEMGKHGKKRGRASTSSFEIPQRSFTGADWRPCFNDRLTMFIAGAPGAGKSYLARQMINLLPKDIEIMLFTALEENDGNFDELGKERLFKIKMTVENLGKITLKEIRERSKAKQTLLLFDDVDKIRDSKIQSAVFNLMNDALANGRGHEKHDGNGDIHVICTSHSANDYQKN